MPTAKSPADLVRAAKGDAGTLKPDEVRIALQRNAHLVRLQCAGIAFRGAYQVGGGFGCWHVNSF